MSDQHPFGELVESMKKAAGALRGAGIQFMLGGGLGCAARGGPETDHDVDFLLRQEDAEHAVSVLENAGFRPQKPPEGWLYKAWDGEVFIDLIFSTAAGDIGDEHFERANELEVYAVPMLVQAPEDLIVMKLLALDEMSLDYKPCVEITRALREQIDWDEVRERTKESPYAKAFFTLVEELGIVERAGAAS
jgi:Uncharacterised nucleotidyltransferase